MANLTISTQVPDAVDIEYRIGGTTTGLLGSAALGTYWIPANPTDGVETRTVGAGGAKSAYVSKTVPAVAAPTVTLQVREENLNAVAPFGIAIDCVTTGFATEDKHGQATYDPAAHLIEYKTVIEKVGDPSWQETFWPKLEKLPDANKVKGIKFEKSFAHVFGRADITGTSSTFRFTTTAIETDTGRSGVSSVVERTISSPEAYFAPEDNYIVSPSGDLTGAPSSTNGVFSTILAARSAIATDAPLPNGRAAIWVENGHEYDEGIPIDFFGAWGQLGMYTWGAGSRAVLKSDTDIIELSRGQFYMSGFDVQAIQGVFEVTSTGWNVIEDVDCVGSVGSFFQGDNETNCAFLVANSRILDWRFNLSGNPKGGRLGVFLGCKCVQTEITSSDEEGGGGYGVRNFNHDVVYASQNDWHVRAGWFNNYPGISDSQPIWRIIYNSPTPDGAMVLFDRNYFEGKIRVSSAQPFPLVNLIFRKNLFVGKDDTGIFIENIGYGTATDNTFIRPATVGAQDSPTNNNFNTAFFITDGAGERAAGDPGVGPLLRGNLLINFQTAYDPEIYRTGTTSTNAPPRLENNLRYFPYSPNPVTDADFSRVFNAAPYFFGYDERTLDNQSRDPKYEVLVDEDATLVGTFEVGDTVRGASSGYVKTLVGFNVNFRGGGFEGYTFAASVINDNFVRANNKGTFERFTPGEKLEVIDGNGDPTGTEVVCAVAGGLGISFDTSAAMIGLIPRTVTATHVIEFSGAGGFEPGETVSGTSETATVAQEFGNRLYLINPSGVILSGESLSAPSGASGTATSDQERSGVGDLWLPTTNTAIDGEYSAFDMLGTQRTFATAIKGPLLALPI